MYKRKGTLKEAVFMTASFLLLLLLIVLHLENNGLQKDTTKTIHKKEVEYDVNTNTTVLENKLIRISVNKYAKNETDDIEVNDTNLNLTMSESLINSTDKLKEEPLYFIMHIGPPKTGTTTLQCSLRYLEEENLLPSNVGLMEAQACTKLPAANRKVLKKKIINNNMFDTNDWKSLIKTNIMEVCFNQWDGKGMPKCWNSGYVPYIQKQQELNKSIIVSKETASLFIGRDLIKMEKSLKSAYKFWDDFTLSIGNRFHTIILITYRNFFDWIYSYYTEKNKHLSRPLLLQWPSKGGRKIPTPEEFVESHTSRQSGHVRIFFPDSLLQRFSKKQINSTRMSIKIINMDKNDDVKREFFCHGLPSSFHMCNLVNKTIIPEQNKAPNYLWCDMLAVDAYEKGLIKSKMLRGEVFDLIKEHQEKRGLTCSGFPKSCPSDVFYEKLFQTSMKLHYKIFPNDDHSIEVEYREKFERTKYKFCTLNSTAVFEDEGWRSFFTTLKKKDARHNRNK